MIYNKEELLSKRIEHIDIKKFDVTQLIDSFDQMAFQSRNLAKACRIYDNMIKDKDCTIILCLAGSLVSAGLKKVVIDLIENNMIDAIVSSGAIVVDQDFFEGLGFYHYHGFIDADDNKLRDMMIDRIYDTFINEEDLRSCDMTINKIADTLEPRPYSSREFIIEMGRYLDKNNNDSESFVLSAYQKGVPIFCPAFTDSSAGFGLVYHQTKKKNHISIDSVKDFKELTEIKINSKETGIIIVGGGVPKNFIQDTVVAADILDINSPMHKYAVQLTVADERDGALSGSTFKEASSWGKVTQENEQLVFGEATILFPLLASYAYHIGNWKHRKPNELNSHFL